MSQRGVVRRIVHGLVLGMALHVGGMGLSWSAIAEDAPAGENHANDQTDWPTVISSLQQQSLDHPGLAHFRKQLAIAHNNYGIILGDKQQWGAAVYELQEAITLDPSVDAFRQNLCRLYVSHAQHAYQEHQIPEALEALDQATKINPQSAEALALRGEIEYYGRQNLKEAKEAWSQAAAVDPNQPGLAAELDQVTRELPVESKFNKLSQAYFDIRYEERLTPPVGFDLRDVLLEARREVGSDFAYWPQHKIVVLLYSAESFRKLRRETPEWLGGVFEGRIQGKIRIPLPDAQLNFTAVKATLFHEYTHALIHDLTDNHCPTWLNEGLADVEGAKQSPRSLQRLRQAMATNALIPWTELSNHFSMTASQESANFAYEESYSIVSYLVQRYGFWRIRRILAALKTGKEWQDVFTEEFHMKLSRLETEWKQRLQESFSQ